MSKLALNKFLLTLVAITGLSIVGSRLYKAYYTMMPIARPGECISVIIGDNNSYEGVVFYNDNENHSSTVVFGYNTMNPLSIDIKYSELRSMDAKKVKCHAI